MSTPLGNAEDTLLLFTRYGTVAIDLFPDIATETVAQIKFLATDGQYDNVAFHRVVPGFVAQTGDVQFGDTTDGFNPGRVGQGGSTRDDLPLEPSDISFERGIVGMARAAAPDSGNSQFFIMLQDAPSLDGRFTVFGEVTYGMQFVDQIRLTEDAAGVPLNGPLDTIGAALIPDTLAPGATSVGTGNRDRLNGDDDKEAFFGLGGRDKVAMGGGADTAVGGEGNDVLRLGGGRDTGLGQRGNDKVFGGNGRDQVDGGRGDDLLRGQAGRDTLIGGTGDDRMEGGNGADTFRFTSDAFGNDRILDFNPARDRIDLRQSGYTLDDANVREVKGDTRLSFDGKQARITLEDVVNVSDGLSVFVIEADAIA